MKILVLGSSGRLGRQIMQYFIKENFFVFAHYFKNKINYNSKNIKSIKFDINKIDSADLDYLNDVKYIINCIGETKNQTLINKTNSKSLVIFLQKIKKLNFNNIFSWIQISSIGVYGNSKAFEINEESKCFPSNEYENSKYQFEKILKEESLDKSFNYVILRPSIIYGPNIRNNVLDGLFQIAKLNFFIIPKNINHLCPFIDVRVISEIVLQIIKRNNVFNETFNISNNYKIEEIKDAIEEVIKKKLYVFRLNDNLIIFFFKIFSIFLSKKIGNALNFFLSKKKYSNSKIVKFFKYKNNYDLIEFIKKSKN